MNCRTLRACRTIALLAPAIVGVVAPSYARQVAADFDRQANSAGDKTDAWTLGTVPRGAGRP